MYVASGNTIHKYKGRNGPWNTTLRPGGRITHLAATGDYLYALCYPNDTVKSVIKRYTNDILDTGWDEWEIFENSLDENSYVRSIYGVNNIIFIGIEKDIREEKNSSEIYYINGNNIIELTGAKLNSEEVDGKVEKRASVLNGVAYVNPNYYLSTNGDTIFSTDLSVTNPITNGEIFRGEISMGIINLNVSTNTIAVISRKGELYIITGGTISKETYSLGKDFLATGALAIWEDQSTPPKRLLLAGRQNPPNYSTSSGYTYGYLELELDENGIIGSDFEEPGGEGLTTTVDNYDRYVSTIGKNPINHIFQAPTTVDPPDPGANYPGMTLFASTQKNGVWSYRERNKDPQWNAEGKGEEELSR
jgi:hypothetical protein